MRTPLLVLFGICPSLVQAQFFLKCRTGSVAELEYNIRAHEEQSYRLNQKFLDRYYYQGPLPADFRPVELREIRQYLQLLEPTRRVGLLFYSHLDNYVCVWLVSPGGVTSHVAPAEESAFMALATRLAAGLGVSGAPGVRSPRRVGVRPRAEVAQRSVISLGESLRSTSELLLPATIRQAILRESLDAIAIVPVSPVGLIPFSALQIGDKPLVDLLAVSVVPGFFAFRKSPTTSRVRFKSAIVAGDPRPVRDRGWTFPPLPGAREEVTEVATMLGTTPLLGEDVSKLHIADFIRTHPETDLIYLATHGIADPTDPLDASFLLMSDGRWPATAVQNLRLEAGPLVVLSACQTGLGRDFDVGTIGMARAWERAGASAVVMSLWSVDDQATKQLMTQFLGLARTLPADEALRQAVQHTRGMYPHPANWAGFAVFGVPAR